MIRYIYISNMTSEISFTFHKWTCAYFLGRRVILRRPGGGEGVVLFFPVCYSLKVPWSYAVECSILLPLSNNGQATILTDKLINCLTDLQINSLTNERQTDNQTNRQTD